MSGATSSKESSGDGHHVVTVATGTTASAEAPTKSAQELVVELRRANDELKRENELLQANVERLGDELAAYQQKHDLETKGLNEFLRKVNHYSRVVANADISKQFYVDVLGCTVLNRPNFPVPGYWLWMGNIQLHLIEGKHVDLRMDGVAVGNVNHISFEAHDIGRVQTRLEELEIPYEKKLIPEAGYLLVQLFFADPDGYYIEVCTCDQMNDFIFASDPASVRDGQAANALAGYTEGVEPVGPTLALMAGLSLASLGDSDPFCSTEALFQSMLAKLQKVFVTVAPGAEEIAPENVLELLHKLGHPNVNADQLTSLLMSADLDASKSLSFVELLKLFVELIKGTRDNIKQALGSAFQAADADGSGALSRSEVLQLVWCLGIPLSEDAADQVFAKVDRNADGKIVIAELSDMVLEFSAQLAEGLRQTTAS
ncbi:Calmodulin [Hondaea fermentalgiana]|uniref:Calmodulin n=1 Tax=Hondaea fermentalgiana TaxID=2315210 RepID=A0A2R5GGA4_9STRA|nr:Calmodulin [Hondaea fermentalgiana]|eukprot:GBG26874.1 Calmodulin [Hondaea fermentalgiana]